MHFTSWTSGTILLGFILTAHSLPSSNTLNSQNGQNSQLLNGELQQYQQHPLQSQVQGPSQTASSKQGTPGTFVFAPNPSNSNYSPLSNQPGYQQQIAPSYQGYGRDVSGPAQQSSSSPFFGLASNGDFQLSAYFSTIFWGFVSIVVPIAAIIYLIRNFFPSAFSGLVKSSKDAAGTGKALDLERITDIVYRALEGQWAVKDTRDGIHHGKVR